MALECRPVDCLAYADSPNYCPHDLVPYAEDVHEDSVPTLPEVGEERPSGCRVNGLSSRKPQAAVRKTYL